MNNALIIVSGLSGSGKTVTLQALEDLGYYCVDNLPGRLLSALVEEVQSQPERYPRVALGIDARSGVEGLEELPALLDSMSEDTPLQLLFLDTAPNVLVRRFSETRRRHPLSSLGSIETSIAAERKLLEPVRKRADWIIDTSESNVHELRREVWRTVGMGESQPTHSVVLQSFGFKHGVPRDVDLMFDARCLPNPHWVPELRASSGLDAPVRDYLAAHPIVDEFCADVLAYLRRWRPALAEDLRSLVSVGIGCTGGQHRSVYVVERIAQALRDDGLHVLASHRELER